MKRLIQSLFVLMLVVLSSQVQAQDALIFSEYIEGSSNNKAIELFNPNGIAVDLADYQIAQSSNGGGWAFYHTFPEGASIVPYGTYVILNDAVDPALFNAANADEVLGFPSVVHHNGDDARAIIHINAGDTTLIDVLGDPDNDPGSGWAVGDSAAATRDHTLVRKSSIAAGNTEILGSFGTDDATSEWMVMPQNDFSNLGYHDFDGTPFSIRDLNTYPGVTEFDSNVLTNHPLVGETVTFTAVIVSNPKTSGNSTPRDTDGDEEFDEISRIHVFVTDTSAIARGREGMSIQIVQEPDFQLFEDFERGDVVTITGSLGFFFSTAQFLASEAPTLRGSVYINYPQFLPLLDPVEITVDELNRFEDGQLELNWDSYSKYNGTYVSLTNAIASNIAFDGRRVDWAVNENGSRIYTYDLSLRVRNDRTDAGYLPGWNYRRPDVEGEFVAPPAGALVDVNGFLILNGGNDPDGIYGSSVPFSINPFETGDRWFDGESGPIYCENGVFCEPEGDVLVWPNDINIIGLPPIVSNVALSDSSVASNQEITVTANAEAAEDGGSIAKVELIYFVAGEADTVAMTNTAGNEYSAMLPGFANLTPVSFIVEATDNSGFVGKAPEAGAYSFFVTDTQITSIAFVQTPEDGESSSPLADVGPVPSDITATVVTSAILDGFITIQDRAAAWSGIFVATGGDADVLEVGDIINITEFEVTEVFGISTMAINEFTAAGTNDMADTLAVTGLLTQDISEDHEPYEGVLVTLADVKVLTNQADGTRDFGEAEIGSRQGGAELDTLEVGEGLRFDDLSSRFAETTNELVKIGATFESFTSVVYFSFGNPKLVGGNPEYFVSEDVTYPNPRFALATPTDGAMVEVTGDITVEWAATTDYDGNDVAYEWVLYLPDSSEVVAVPSNNEGADASVTLAFATVDGLLEGAGLSVGESADFLWSVRVNDGFDTLNVATTYDINTNTFDTLFYAINLTRGLDTNSELENGIPTVFNLEQNYPNPFNPSTNINFALPQSSKVTLNVYDMLGRKVATLIDGEQLQAANHSVKFDASALASGMYIYRIEAGSFVSTRKMMLIK